VTNSFLQLLAIKKKRSPLYNPVLYWHYQNQTSMNATNVMFLWICSLSLWQLTANDQWGWAIGSRILVSHGHIDYDGLPGIGR